MKILQKIKLFDEILIYSQEIILKISFISKLKYLNFFYKLVVLFLFDFCSFYNYLLGWYLSLVTI